MPIKTITQQKYVRDYSAVWFSKASDETNCFASCRYSSNSLGTNGKFREVIQKLSITTYSPWLCLYRCEWAVTKSSSCVLTLGHLGVISDVMLQAHLAHTLRTCLAGWLAGKKSWTYTEPWALLPELLPKPKITRKFQKYEGSSPRSEIVCKAKPAQTSTHVCSCLSEKLVWCKC